MSRKEFEVIVASAVRESVKTIDLSTNVPVAGNGVIENIDLYASPGTIGIIQSMVLNHPAPAAATTGTHWLMATTPAATGSFVYGESNFGDAVVWNRKCWETATFSQKPPSDAAQVAAFVGNVFDDTISFRISYANNTNATQDQLRQYKFTWIERVVGA